MPRPAMSVATRISNSPDLKPSIASSRVAWEGSDELKSSLAPAGHIGTHTHTHTQGSPASWAVTQPDREGKSSHRLGPDTCAVLGGDAGQGDDGHTGATHTDTQTHKTLAIGPWVRGRSGPGSPHPKGR